MNARRFLVTDLVLGRIGRDHELYSYVRKHGATERDLDWFPGNAARIHILGLDYYLHSEMDWIWSREKNKPDIAPLVHEPRGFASIARDYVGRYGLPIMLSETNVVGTVHERISWLKLMEAECEELAATADFRGFCWYPSIDTTDWSNGCTRYTGEIDKQGIWSLRPGTLERVDTELSHVYGQLARGVITSSGLPDYGFGPALARRLAHYRQRTGKARFVA